VLIDAAMLLCMAALTCDCRYPEASGAPCLPAGEKQPHELP
jgi:hypothetical protein